MSKLTTAILDVLSDGEWHTSKKITDRACAIASAKRNNVAVALHEMTESNKIKRQQFGSTDHDYQYCMGTLSVGFGRILASAADDSTKENMTPGTIELAALHRLHATKKPTAISNAYPAISTFPATSKTTRQT